MCFGLPSLQLFQGKAGKRTRGPTSVNAATPSSSSNKIKNNLLYVHDASTQQKWLIDGGAVLSIIPPTLAQRLNGPTSTQLQAANGTKIPCYGVRNVNIHLADRKILFPVTIADVSQPILGADFLAHAYLAPNHRDGTLIDIKDMSVLRANIEKEAEPIRINHVSQAESPYYQLLDNKFPALSNPSFKIKEVDHGVLHYIPTEGQPVQARARKLDPEKLSVAKAEIDKLVELGVCQRGKSEWSSPLLVTTKPCNSPCTCDKEKPCGGWRVCGDYRRLNHMTTTDRYPVRNLQDFNSDLRGKKIFSKVDLLKGYHQIPVNPVDIKKTAVITPFGLFVFPRCPFGLKNAGQDFQRLMDRILGDIPHTFVYLDDILIASETKEQHLEDLERVFKILEENGLVVNRKKCVLGVSTIEFLGHLCDEQGIKPLPAKVEAIKKVKAPTTIKELQRFLGMVNYYRRFIKKAAHHLFHLFECLGKKPKKLDWSPDMAKSFEAIKSALANAALLHHPDSKLPLAITSDASKVAMGAVLEQRGPNGWEPLAFFSKKFSTPQQEWPPYDRELNAAHKSIRHFKHMVEGRPFTLYTDHQSLVPSMAKKTEAQTARQANQLSEISEYTTDIRYLEGKSNVVADALSRPNGEGSDAPPKVSNITKSKKPPPEHLFLAEINRMRANGSLGVYLEETDGLEEDVDEQLADANESPDEQLQHQQQQLDPFDEVEGRLDSLIQDLDLLGKEREKLKKPPPSSTTPTASTSSSSSKKQRRNVTFASPIISSIDSSNPIPDKRDSEEMKQFLAFNLEQMQQHPDLQRFVNHNPSEQQQQPQPPVDSSSNSSSNDDLTSRPVPDEKLENLQLVINSIDHYSIDMEDLARQQALDADFRRLLRDARTGLSFRKIKVGTTFLYVDISNGPARPFVPLSFRRRIFNVIHGLGHPGVERTRQAVADKFVWPSMRQDVTKWARECLPCQQAKIHRHTVPPIAEFAIPAKRFQHVHIDLVSMPHSNGFSHLLTIVDRFSRWPAAIPLADINADTVMDAFAHGWISSHGVPEVVTSDRGSQFSSAIFTQLMQTWGVKHLMTTAYHPEANGMVERLHRRLKESLIALGEGDRHGWFWKLPMTLLALRTTVKPDIDASPSDMVYGEGLTVPGQLVGPPQMTDDELLRAQRASRNNLRVEVERLQPKPTSAHRNPQIHIPDELSTASHVLVRKGLQPSLTAPYSGPYKVLERHANGFRIQIPGRDSDIVNLSRLKPAIVADDDDDAGSDSNDVTPPSPPPPGRPPGLRTRIPEPTSRVTRSNAQRQRSDVEPIRSDPANQPCSSRDVPGEPLPDSPPIVRRRRPNSRPVVEDDDPIDPTGRVNVPDDPNLSSCPDAVGESIIADAFPHIPDPIGRDPNDVDQPLLPPPQAHTQPPLSVTNSNPQGGAGKKSHTFSKPTKGNFSYRRRKPDVSAISELIRNSLR